MTIAAQVGGDPTPRRPACPSAKLGFVTATEARWYVGRFHGLSGNRRVYRCPWPSCALYHWTGKARAETKRTLRAMRQRHEDQHAYR
jgi:hypothetical protein